MTGLVLPRARLVPNECIEELTLMPVFEVDLGLGFLPLQFKHLAGADRGTQGELSPLFFIGLVASSVLEGTYLYSLLLLVYVFSHRAEDEVVLGVLSTPDDQLVVNELQKELLKLIDLVISHIAHNFREVDVFE